MPISQLSQGVNAIEPTESSPTTTRSWLALSLLGVALLLGIVVRIRLLDYPLERDEGEYAYAGQLLLQGVPPYESAYNMKLPGTYLAYAGLMAVCGQTVAGVHLGLLLVNVATIGLVFVLTRSLFDAKAAGGAALVYAVLSVSTSVLGLSGHATHFVSLFGVAGTALLWGAMQAPHWRRALGSGVLFGVAFLMKQQGVFLMVFGGVFLLSRLYYGPVPYYGATQTRRLAFRDLVAYCLGSITPYLLICGWLWSAGVWENFKFWTIDYAAQYVQGVSWDDGVGMFLYGATRAVGANSLLWLLAAFGFATLLGKMSSESHSGAAGATSRERCGFIAGYLLFSALCVCPGLLFRQHYFIVLLPVIALLAGASCRDWRTSNDMPVTTTGSAAPNSQRIFVLLVAVGITVLGQGDCFFRTSPEALSKQLYGLNPFVESGTIAAYLKEHTRTSDTIAVFGSEPQLFFLSQRRSCTGYIYTYPLVEPQPFALRMQEQMRQQIEQGAPKYFVDVNIRTSWLRGPEDEPLFAWKDNYLKMNYERVGIIEIFPDRTVYHWDGKAVGYEPMTRDRVDVYRKRLGFTDASG